MVGISVVDFSINILFPVVASGGFGGFGDPRLWGVEHRGFGERVSAVVLLAVYSQLMQVEPPPPLYIDRNLTLCERSHKVTPKRAHRIQLRDGNLAVLPVSLSVSTGYWRGFRLTLYVVSSCRLDFVQPAGATVNNNEKVALSKFFLSVKDIRSSFC